MGMPDARETLGSAPHCRAPRAPGNRTAGLAAALLAPTPPPRPRLPLAALSSVASQPGWLPPPPAHEIARIAAPRRAGGAQGNGASALLPGTLSRVGSWRTCRA